MIEEGRKKIVRSETEIMTIIQTQKEKEPN